MTKLRPANSGNYAGGFHSVSICVTIPKELCKQMKWKLGDEVVWRINDAGVMELKKV